MRFIREFGLVVGGGLALLTGYLLVLFVPAAGTSFGWTAYAPLADTTFAAGPPISAVSLASELLVIVGVIALAADVAYRVGRGRRATAAESSGA